MILDRRHFLTTGSVAIGCALIPATAIKAAGSSAWEAARDSILDGRVAEEGGIALDLPEVAENGAQVPFSVLVESPMTEDDHVLRVHVLATENPEPGVGQASFSHHMPRAEYFTRIRLGREQDILVLAELSDGRVLQQAAHIRVTAGGCAI